MGSNLMNFDITGIKLDEICTPNPFLMLLMARNGLKLPFKGHLRPVKHHVGWGRRCWWERIVLVDKNDNGGSRWCWKSCKKWWFPMECSNQLKNMMINMIIKIVIFDIFTQVPGQTTILAGFAAFFYADSCRRYVKSSFLSPFHDHFCFPSTWS